MTDILFTKVTLRNFLSTGNVAQEINLNTSFLTLILGQNSDSNAGMRNGAGKTTILQAVCYALYGKPLTKIKIPNLCNNINGKNMQVALDLERDGIKYRIERGTKPAYLRYFVNGVEVKDESAKNDATGDELGENRRTQIEIERVIGMSLMMFRQILGLNTFTEPFLKLGAKDQRELIEELLTITQLSEKAATLHAQITTSRDLIRDQEAMVKATTEANARIDAALARAEAANRKWIFDQNTTTARLQSEIEALAGIDYDAELAIFDQLDGYLESARQLQGSVSLAEQHYSQAQRAVESFEAEARRHQAAINALGQTGTVDRLKKEIARHRASVERVNLKIEQLRSEMIKLDEELSRNDHQTCTVCGQDIAGTAHLEEMKTNLQKRMQERSDRIVALVAETKDHHQQVAQIAEEQIAAQDMDEAQRTLLTQQAADALQEAEEHKAARDDQKAALEAARAALTALGPRPQTMFQSRAEVFTTREMRNTLERELEIASAQTNPYSSQIKDLHDAQQKIDYTVLNDTTTLLKHQEFLHRLLTSKDSFIRKTIVDQNLAGLNARLSQYLNKLALPHNVVFQSDLSVEILHLGRDYDYEQLSRGEMNRVNLAMSWAFRDVWEALNHSVSLLWVDELLDQGFDAQGVEAALGILKSMARDRAKHIFLVSHRDDLISRIDSVLLVKKSNEFTEFEQDAVI